jgi:hypothetical protein
MDLIIFTIDVNIINVMNYGRREVEDPIAYIYMNIYVHICIHI